jgi:hypothetical protein
MEYDDLMLYENQRFASVHNQATEQFRNLHRRAIQHKLWSALIGRCNSLLSLYDVQTHKNQVQERSYAGLLLVPIAQIRGSEGRSADFDANFRPLKTHSRERWTRVAIAHSLDMGLPAVELVQVNDQYFVRDGHHRISVAKMMGQREIEAEVTVWRGASLPECGCGQPLRFDALHSIKQSLGNAWQWLGNQFTIWQHSRRLPAHGQTWDTCRQAPC